MITNETYIRLFGDGIFDRLFAEGVELKDPALSVSANGEIAVYELEMKPNGDFASPFSFFKWFAEEYYPSEHAVVRTGVIQIYLQDVHNKTMRCYVTDVAVQLIEEADGRVLLIGRLMNPRYYVDSGCLEATDFVTLTKTVAEFNPPSKVLPNVSDITDEDDAPVVSDVTA